MRKNSYLVGMLCQQENWICQSPFGVLQLSISAVINLVHNVLLSNGLFSQSESVRSSCCELSSADLLAALLVVIGIL